MFLREVSIPIVELDKKFIETNRGAFPVTPISLSIAIAKSSVTKAVNVPYIFWEAFCYMLSIQNKITVTNNNLRLIPGFVNVYRDFSKTSRVGELGQALAYLFAQEHLRLPVVTGFWDFLNAKPIKIRTPDFICTELRPTTEITLIESKSGGSARGMKTKIKDGHAQIKRGAQYIRRTTKGKYAVRKTYAAYSEFREGDSPFDTRFCFQDPEEEEKSEIPFPRHVFLKYYAHWFYVFGRIDLSNALFEGDIEKIKKSGKESNGRYLKFDINERYPFFIPYLNFFPFNVASIEIHTDILSFLSSYPKELPNKMIFERSIRPERETFIDGTAVNIELR